MNTLYIVKINKLFHKDVLFPAASQRFLLSILNTVLSLLTSNCQTLYFLLFAFMLWVCSSSCSRLHWLSAFFSFATTLLAIKLIPNTWILSYDNYTFVSDVPMSSVWIGNKVPSSGCEGLWSFLNIDQCRFSSVLLVLHLSHIKLKDHPSNSDILKKAFIFK